MTITQAAQAQTAKKAVLELHEASQNERDSLAGAQLHLEQLSREDWLAFAPKMFGYNFRQSWAYGQAVAQHFGASSEHVGIFSKDKCIGLAGVRVRRIPVFGGGIAYISGGPLVASDFETTFDQALSWSLRVLTNEYVRRRGFALRISPPIEWVAAGLDANPFFHQLQFFVPDQINQYRTLLVDLSPSVEQLRRNLDSRWRTCLKRSEGRNLTVHSGHEVELLDRFCPLFKELVKRKGFSVELSADFYRQLQSKIDAADKFYVKLVESEGQIVAGHVGSILGQTSVALLVASSQPGYNLKAAHLLHWRSILEAKERGCKWYDLGGIDPVNVPGVYQFKKLVRGTDLTAHGPFELSPSPIRARLTSFAENIYRKLRPR